jgi:hypothetical protein
MRSAATLYSVVQIGETLPPLQTPRYTDRCPPRGELSGEVCL